MIKEYKTISEVAGPLMLVKDVEGATYDELGEITLPSGEKRLCKVLEINGKDVLVQLFDSAAGINLKESAVSFSVSPAGQTPSFTAALKAITIPMATA